MQTEVTIAFARRVSSPGVKADMLQVWSMAVKLAVAVSAPVVAA